MNAIQPINSEIVEFFGADAPGTKEKTVTLTLKKYADAKELPLKFLKEQFRLEDSTDGVKMPYLNTDGTLFRNKARHKLEHGKMMLWLGQAPTKSATKTIPYGLWLVKSGTKHLFIVEGESNTQTLRFHKFAAIGISGATGWDDSFAELQCFKDAEVITVVQDPDDDGEALVNRLAQSPIQPKLRVIKMSKTGFKDVSELHLHDVNGFTETLRTFSRERVSPVEKPAKIAATIEALEDDAVTIENMMIDAQVLFKDREPYNGGFRWILDECPFDSDHTGTDAAVILQSDGKKLFNCVHKNSCSVNLSDETPWSQFRKYCEDQIGEKVKFAKPTVKTEPKVDKKPEVNIIAASSSSNAITFPVDIGKAALQGIIGDFVATALPYSEADKNCLAYGALVALGNALGRTNYVPFGSERHYPNLDLMNIGTTSSGKGQGDHAVREFARLINADWYLKRWKFSAASGEGLVKLLSMECADNRMMLTLTEMSILLNSMNREGSNLSGYIRAAYDGIPLQNNKARESVSADNYHLSCVGQITPRELSTIMADVDWYNGVSNRFLWNIVQRSKTLSRSTTVPDFTKLADRVKSILSLPTAGKIDFSPAGAAVWDDWVHGLKLNDDTKLGASQERVRPNALRIALIYASLDENRLKGLNGGMVYEDGDGGFQIEPKHVEAAIEVVSRSKASVEWFLSQAITIDREPDFKNTKKVVEAYNKAMDEGRTFTSTNLHNLFTRLNPEERNRIATAAGLIGKPAVSGRGAKATTWIRA